MHVVEGFHLPRRYSHLHVSLCTTTPHAFHRLCAHRRSQLKTSAFRDRGRTDARASAASSQLTVSCRLTLVRARSCSTTKLASESHRYSSWVINKRKRSA